MSAATIDAIRAAGGRRIKGPAAFTGDFNRALQLTWTLAYLEFRLKFFGSVLGYVWQLARPLMMFGIYYVLFTQFIPLSEGVVFFPPMLLFGIMLYQFWAEATSASVQAVLTRENLVRKIHFPRIVIPMSVIVQAGLNLAVNLVAVAIFMAASGVPVRASWIQAIPLLAFLTIFASGLAMLLSALFVRYRDVQPIWEVVTMAAFYATPILYPLEAVKFDWARQLIMYNPLAVVQQQLRHAVFDPTAINAKDAIGGWLELSVPVALVFATFALGLWVFNRTAPAVAEEL